MTMNIKMKNTVNNRTALYALYALEAMMMVVHGLFLIFFACTGVRLMLTVNIFSLLVYAVSFLLIKRMYLTVYTAVVFLEVSIHMFLSVLCLGWGYGFQLYFLVCVPVIFYADYFSVKLGHRHVHGFLLSVASGLLYFVTLVYVRYHEPLYSLDNRIEYVMLAVNSLVVIVFSTVFLGALARTAANTEAKLERQATHDMLTGMSNRNYLIEQLGVLFETEHLKDYWLAILDIDDFKAINDVYGHNCGDYVLKSVAKLIQKNSGGMISCRWGGEEFLLVGHEGLTKGGAKTSHEVLERIRRAVEENDFIYEGTKIKLTITIGMASHTDEQTIDEWINIADMKLYSGKNSGKNRLVV